MSIVIDQTEIYALTLYQPWCWVMSEGYKLIENRPWKPPEKLIGQWIAFHAGNAIDPYAEEFISKLLPGQAPEAAVPTEDRLHHGAVLSVGRLFGTVYSDAGDIKWVHSAPFLFPVRPKGIPVSSVLHKTGEDLDKRFLPYFFGPFGWAFDKMVKLSKPIECRGFQRIWRLKPDTMALVKQAAADGSVVA